MPRVRPRLPHVWSFGILTFKIRVLACEMRPSLPRARPHLSMAGHGETRNIMPPQGKDELRFVAERARFIGSSRICSAV